MCCSDFSVAHGGKNDVVAHINTKRHKEAGKSASTSKSVAAFFLSLISIAGQSKLKPCGPYL